MRRLSNDPELARLRALVQQHVDPDFDEAAYRSDRNRLVETLMGLSEPEQRDVAEHLRSTGALTPTRHHVQALLGRIDNVMGPLEAEVNKRLERIASAENTPVEQLREHPELLRAVRMEALLAVRRQPGMYEQVRGLLGQDPIAARALDALGLTASEVASNFDGTVAKLLSLEGVSGLDFVQAGDADLSATLLTARTNQIFGPPSDASDLRVMVTMPTWATERPEWVQRLVGAGMTVMRVNCAHDDPSVWAAHVKAFRAACPTGTVLQDLPGPKLRTGRNAITGHGLKVKVEKDPVLGARDKAGTPIELRFDLEVGRPQDGEQPAQIPLTLSPDRQRLLVDAVNGSKKNVRLMCHDALRPDGDGELQATRNRPLVVEGLIEEGGRIVGVRARAKKTTFFNPNTSVELRTGQPGRPPVIGSIGDLPEVRDDVKVKDGDLLLIRGNADQVGMNADHPDANGVATIGCQLPEAIPQVRPGRDRVFIDDGKVPGLVERFEKDKSGNVTGIYVRVGESAILDQAPTDHVYGIKEGKGINLPDTPLDLDPLTAQDRAALPFIMEHADIVAYSFVQTADDVHQLVDEARSIAKQRGLKNEREIRDWFAQKTICLKVETDKSLDNLVEMIRAVRAAGFKATVMFARGDLAVEKIPDGSRSPITLGRVTERVAAICEALGCPMIYATQLMESLMKKGRINRSESFDMSAASAAFAAVMLNKGNGESEPLVVGEFHRAASKFGRVPELFEALTRPGELNDDLASLLRKVTYT